MQQSFARRLGQMISIVLTITLIVPFIFGSISCAPHLEPINFGGPLGPGSIMIFIAEEKGFFTQNGLEVTLKNYDVGATALDAVAKGDLDIALSGEYPVVEQAFQKKSISIIAVASKATNWYVVGRIDRGIQNIADLKGKRIGTQLKTMGEFYLGRLLNLNGLSMTDITLVATDSTQWKDAISIGRVDAVVVPDRYLNQIKDGLSNNAVVWSAHANQPAFAPISARTEWIAQNPEKVKRFLTSLKQAEDYLRNQPVEAKAILQKRMNVDAAYLETIWPSYSFDLSLDLSLIVAMNDEARWMISNNLTTETNLPDFSKFIYAEGLKAVKPESVNIRMVSKSAFLSTPLN
jgi:ABC-type nitrate/sulfonate/bicarbonate transport system substrate-binding protein